MDDRLPKTRPSPTIPPILPPRTTNSSSLMDDLMHTTPPMNTDTPLYSTVVPKSKRNNPPPNTMESHQPPPRPPLPPRGDNTAPRPKTQSSNTQYSFKYFKHVSVFGRWWCVYNKSQNQVLGTDGVQTGRREESNGRRIRKTTEEVHAGNDAGWVWVAPPTIL